MKKPNKTKSGSSLEKASFEELVRLGRDSYTFKNFILCCDSYSVSVWEQKNGEPPKQEMVTIPRGIFNRLIRNYQKEQRFVRE